MKIAHQILNATALAVLAISLPMGSQAQLLKKLKDKANSVLSQKVDSKIPGTSTPGTPATPAATPAGGTATTAPTISTYKNYDFVPGDKIIFEDHFDSDQEGEFPTHWHLLNGQGAINTFNGQKTLLLTGGQSRLSPAIKESAYLTDSFTVEFDNYSVDDFGPQIWFYKNAEDAKTESTETVKIVFNDRNGFWALWIRTKDRTGESTVKYPEAIGYANYRNKWHHIAIAYKDKRLKIYVDEYRVMSIPEIALNATALAVIGDGTPKEPVMIANFKLALGAGIKTPETKFTDTKIVTHGINFDVNKADIKPESMGTLNTIVSILKNNPDLKFEIQGHTDNSGVAANNLTLSQKRAEAVKKQLVALGVDESRLTTKGFGDTKPISENTSPEGRANNRRVEFVKL